MIKIDKTKLLNTTLSNNGESFDKKHNPCIFWAIAKSTPPNNISYQEIRNQLAIQDYSLFSKINEIEEVLFRDGKGSYFQTRYGSNTDKERAQLFKDAIKAMEKSKAIVFTNLPKCVTVKKTTNKGPKQMNSTLKNERETQGLTVAQLSRKAGVPVSTIRDLENGNHTTRFSTVKKVVAALSKF